MNENRQSLVIVLPCYNEEASIETLVRWIDKRCSHMDYTIIAVDDGSSDQTSKILERLQNKFSIMILSHLRNLGLHEALRSGLSKAVEIAKASDAVIVMDADLTHNPYYINIMMSKLKSHDVIVASRYVKGGRQVGVSFYRRILSRGIGLFGKLVFDLPVTDVTSGYRCYKASVISKIMRVYGRNFIASKGFEVAFELLVKAHKVGAKTTEVPFILDYSRKRSKSKLNVQKTIFDYLKLMTNLLRQ